MKLLVKKFGNYQSFPDHGKKTKSRVSLYFYEIGPVWLGPPAGARNGRKATVKYDETRYFVFFL